MKIYPTLCEVKTAPLNTLIVWEEGLPNPQTDVEKTIMKKIKRRSFELVARETKEKEPSIADSWNELAEELKKIGINNFPKM